MNKEPPNEINENISKETQNREDKNFSNFYPPNEKEPINSRKNSNLFNMQNSGFTNFKSDIKFESANQYM